MLDSDVIAVMLPTPEGRAMPREDADQIRTMVAEAMFFTMSSGLGREDSIQSMSCTSDLMATSWEVANEDPAAAHSELNFLTVPTTQQLLILDPDKLDPPVELAVQRHDDQQIQHIKTPTRTEQDPDATRLVIQIGQQVAEKALGEATTLKEGVRIVRAEFLKRKLSLDLRGRYSVSG